MTDHEAARENPTIEALRDEIQQTRVELGDTVQALAAKADVKARVRESAVRLRDRAKDSAVQAASQVKGPTGEAVGRARRWANETARDARTRVTVLRPDHHWSAGGYGRWLSYRTAAAGDRLTAVGRSVRRHPTPWLVGAAGVLGATGVIVYVVARRSRG